MMSSRDTKTIIIASIIFIIIGTTVTSTTSSSNELLHHCPEQCTCTLITTDHNRSQNHVKCYGLDGIKEDGKNLSIHSLDLSNINLTRLTTTLEKLKDLINLDLSFNHLTEIGRFGKRIQKLNISHNKITSGKLSNLPIHLKYLDLSYNDITYLPLEIKNLKYLRSIELIGNKIQCSCETLDVRNWLQHNHVWTDNHIKCTYPIEVKGKSWLQVRQSDVCEPYRKQSTKISPNIDEENELMLGDDAFHDDGSGDKESTEELGKDYLPIDDKNNKKLSEYKAVDETNIEGSGGGADDEIDIPSSENHDHSTDKTQIERISEHTDDDTNDLETTEASGIGPLLNIVSTVDDDTVSSSTAVHAEEAGEEVEEEKEEEEQDKEDVNESILPIVSSEDNEEDNLTESTSSSTQSPSNEIFAHGLGIVQFSNTTTDESSSEEPPTEVEEAPIVSVSVKVSESEVSVTSKPDQTHENAEIQKASIKIPSETDSNEIAEANANENKSTYILLAIILIILVALIVFVAIKRSRAKRRSKRHEDAENPKETELLDMDKKNLGKPIHKNGNAEHAPLINDRTKSDHAKPVNANGKKVPYETKENDKNAQEPLLKKDETSSGDLEPKQSQTESNNNVPNSTLPKLPLSAEESSAVPEQSQEQPVPAVRQSVAAKPSESVHQYKPGSYPPPKSPVTGGGGGGGETGQSPSPRPSRYSPVYSPETGRVKIKLTETPKPKTPLLVTRSRSNAGDIITTPTSKAEIYKDATLSPTANGQ